MGRPIELDLEPNFALLENGSNIHVLAEIIIRCPGHHVCRSAVSKHLFDFHGSLPHLLRTSFRMKGRHVSVQQGDRSVLWSGIGAVSTCLKFCHAKPSCFVNCNEKFVEWLDLKGIAPVIQGDIDDTRTVQAVADPGLSNAPQWRCIVQAV